MRAGFPVPDGVVLAPGAPVPPLEALSHLGDRLALRSSAGLEDRSGQAAPGVFVSQIDVPRTEPELLRALEAVRASAHGASARAYFAAAGQTGPHDIAVIIQRYIVPTIASGTLYTRPPGQPEEAWARIEAKDPDGVLTVAEVLRNLDQVLPDERFPLGPSTVRALVALALRAEAVIGAPTGADIEWVVTQHGPVIVQARPIVHGRPVRSAPPELFAFSRRDPDQIWRWDVTHNPDPLSPAQSALVDRESRLTGLAMRSVGGYLYTADTGSTVSVEDAPTLRRLFYDQVKPRAERVLTPLEQAAVLSVSDALAAYDEVFAVYAHELAPLLSAARRRVSPRALVHLPPLGAPPTEVEWAAFSPAWDVAVPTYREAGLQPAPLPAAPTESDHAPDPLAHAVRDISELDDRLFYRAQFVVRRALLLRAAELGLRDPSDIFFADHPLSETLQRDRVAAQAERNRAMLEQAQSWHMPLSIRAGRPLAEPWSRGADVWRGVGTGKTTTGVVHRLGSSAHPPPKGAIIVAAAVAPGALLPLREVAAIVSEFDGLLGHTAALARELGIPCVVRCQGAWRDLSDGDRVFVDGQAGLVIRLATI